MRAGLRGERLVALFILAAVAFHPPIVNLFAVGATVLGWPLLYLYVFVAWAAVIALIALITGRADEPPERSGDAKPAPEREG
jgi:hypothetical protein